MSSRWPLVFIAVAAAGCATEPRDSQTSARRHASNVAAAEKTGYRIIEKNGQTLFCATEVTTGSHVLPQCLTEAGWEREPLWVW